jgi:hypothetical protein
MVLGPFSSRSKHSQAESASPYLLPLPGLWSGTEWGGAMGEEGARLLAAFSPLGAGTESSQ